MCNFVKAIASKGLICTSLLLLIASCAPHYNVIDISVSLKAPPRTELLSTVYLRNIEIISEQGVVVDDIDTSLEAYRKALSKVFTSAGYKVIADTTQAQLTVDSTITPMMGRRGVTGAWGNAKISVAIYNGEHMIVERDLKTKRRARSLSSAYMAAVSNCLSDFHDELISPQWEQALNAN